MRTFIGGFLLSIILALGYLVIIAPYIGGVFLIAYQVIERFELYGWIAIAILITYTIIFIGILGGLEDLFKDEDVNVLEDEP